MVQNMTRSRRLQTPLKKAQKITEKRLSPLYEKHATIGNHLPQREISTPRKLVS